MRMISPQVEAPQITIAEEQHEFLELTAALVIHPIHGRGILLAFRLSEEEQQRIASGADVYLSLITHWGPMQPVLPLVGKEEAASAFGLKVSA